MSSIGMQKDKERRIFEYPWYKIEGTGCYLTLCKGPKQGCVRIQILGWRGEGYRGYLEFKPADLETMIEWIRGAVETAIEVGGIPGGVGAEDRNKRSDELPEWRKQEYEKKKARGWLGDG